MSVSVLSRDVSSQVRVACHTALLHLILAPLLMLLLLNKKVVSRTEDFGLSHLLCSPSTWTTLLASSKTLGFGNLGPLGGDFLGLTQALTNSFVLLLLSRLLRFQLLFLNILCSCLCFFLDLLSGDFGVMLGYL